MKLADGLADFDLGALGNEDFESPIRFGKDLRSHLVGFDFKESIAGGNDFPVFLFPAPEDSGGD